MRFFPFVTQGFDMTFIMTATCRDVCDAQPHLYHAVVQSRSGARQEGLDFSAKKAGRTLRCARLLNLIVARLEVLADLLEEIDCAAGIAPFVIVPAYEFEEFLIQLDAAARIKDA